MFGIWGLRFEVLQPQESEMQDFCELGIATSTAIPSPVSSIRSRKNAKDHPKPTPVAPCSMQAERIPTQGVPIHTAQSGLSSTITGRETTAAFFSVRLGMVV